MKIHANAKLGPKGRLVMVKRVATARKWVRRHRAEGEAGLADRSSEPRRVPHATPEERIEAIAALRRVRLTGEEIALALGMASSTVSVLLRRIGLGKLGALEPPEPPNRYEPAPASGFISTSISWSRLSGEQATA